MLLIKGGAILKHEERREQIPNIIEQFTQQATKSF